MISITNMIVRPKQKPNQAIKMFSINSVIGTKTLHLAFPYQLFRTEQAKSRCPTNETYIPLFHVIQCYT